VSAPATNNKSNKFVFMLSWRNMRTRPLVHHDTFRRLSRSRDFLAAHLDQRVGLACAAGEAHLSQYHYHRMFSQAFGETPHEFVSRLRIEKAKSLLAVENLSVTEICLESGYESLGTFSSRFRSVTGMSPVQFRREIRRVYQSALIVPARFVPHCFLRHW
jgi:AraC-like DNA-binding protein